MYILKAGRGRRHDAIGIVYTLTSLSVSTEIPSWLKDYVDAPFGSDKDNLQVRQQHAKD